MTKLEEWKLFSARVENHITNYVRIQYGDYPDEEIENWTVEDVRTHLRKYVSRLTTIEDIRGPGAAGEDALKIAHYACYLLKKLEE